MNAETVSDPVSIDGATWCCEFEVSGSRDLRAVVAQAGEPLVRVLIRIHDEPVGYLTLTREEATTPAILAEAWRRFGDRIGAHLAAEGVPAPGAGPGYRPGAAARGCPSEVDTSEHVSVIVCTRDRGEMLQDCVGRLAEISYPRVEFIIVDNAPSDESTERLVSRLALTDPRFRYVLEPRPGLSRARNAGLAAARGRYVAYTDDDVSVDPRWVHGVLRGFSRRPDVVCVTGLVCTASISNDSEAYFDARTSSWSSRCAPALFDLRDRSGHGALYPYSAGIFGTGASFAFDRDSLRALGGFDEALGAGTDTKGGEDLDVFVRVLTGGGAIAYEPAALVWHHHRADQDSLRKQMFGYGAGLAAFLTKLLAQRSTRSQILLRLPYGVIKMAKIPFATNQRLQAEHSAPPGALRREIAGLAAGPFLYARSRRNVHAAAPPRPRAGASVVEERR
ncbi:hypothetical protein Ahu01nite_001050 [Winogradskya humida]|uniref:Glycosyltransferase 2-like domain-containing protein n=1 Tax=Winogradskya humida TaxID=113566 RepID=A0ABQ3ZEQ8_9ACTN|nr:hypothetical protein Ahu01nite_001050 [Actinoplanes humidus]